MNTYRIALDAGHYKNTPGKRCLKSIDPNETREWYLNSRICDKIQSLLKDYNCEVLRLDDTTGNSKVTLEERVKKSNSWKADILVSVHHNAGINGGSGGGIVVFNSSKYPNNENERLKKLIYNGLIKYTGLKGNRSNPTPTGNLYIINYTKATAVLCECGFMDSTVDTPIILTEEFADNAAKGIVEGIMEYSGIEKKTNPADVPAEYAKDAWEWGIENNLTTGERPLDGLTRQDFMLMLYKYHTNLGG